MEFSKYLPVDFCNWFKTYSDTASDITVCRNENIFISVNAALIESQCFITDKEFDVIVGKLCNGSLYANQNTLRKGYLTLNGGHRIGMTGTLSRNENGLTFLRDITAFNIRISRNIPDAAKNIEPYIRCGRDVFNTLIIAPPSAGKTTALKDIAIKLGQSMRVGVVDERGEFDGIKKNGSHIFIIKGASKHEGILSLLRSMSPQVIITDEIGTENDEIAIFKLLNAGVKIICSAHGYDENDVMRREIFKSLIQSHAFERLVVMSRKEGPCSVDKIINTQEMDKIG